MNLNEVEIRRVVAYGVKMGWVHYPAGYKGPGATDALGTALRHQGNDSYFETTPEPEAQHVPDRDSYAVMAPEEPESPTEEPPIEQ